MLEHLKLFLGASTQNLNHYMIRFTPGYCEFITTNGYALAVNSLPVKHNFKNVIIAVSVDEFQKIIMLEPGLEFDDHLQVGTDGIFFPLEQLGAALIPDLNVILGIPPVNTSVDVKFSVKNFTLVAKYCKLIGVTEFKQEFTGDKYPTIISDDSGKWKIYLMPLGE